ncbi:hypothetical protein ACMATS_23400 [Streptoverticillium reticulum]|uniref:hypothetical protein n=1 Tax=Streptoverticillium reticulum TaxID=1433415 RepID=UPI0039BFF93F
MADHDDRTGQERASGLWALWDIIREVLRNVVSDSRRTRNLILLVNITMLCAAIFVAVVVAALLTVWFWLSSHPSGWLEAAALSGGVGAVSGLRYLRLRTARKVSATGRGGRRRGRDEEEADRPAD